VKGHVLYNTQNFEFEYDAHDRSMLEVEFTNKNINDTDLDRGLDKVVIIEQVSFFGINDPRFVWAGTYYPTYPDEWTDRDRTVWKNALKSHSYLSWNGVWRLDFPVPVFTWIHRVQGQGWIFD
jgi:hypothetical protein